MYVKLYLTRPYEKYWFLKKNSTFRKFNIVVEKEVLDQLFQI